MLPVSTTRTHTPATFTIPAMALRLGAEVLDLAPSVGTLGSELDLDPAAGVKSGAGGKNWVQYQETQNSSPLATRTRAVPGRRPKPALTSRRKPGYRSIPIRDRQK